MVTILTNVKSEPIANIVWRWQFNYRALSLHFCLRNDLCTTTCTMALNVLECPCLCGFSCTIPTDTNFAAQQSKLSWRTLQLWLPMCGEYTLPVDFVAQGSEALFDFWLLSKDLFTIFKSLMQPEKTVWKKCNKMYKIKMNKYVNALCDKIIHAC